ncbi:MAG: SPOR domain-containing protein [Legionellaceae bacterium]|nr:SPOR domain-containing protein [Legionellaceae bacterium]
MIIKTKHIGLLLCTATLSACGVMNSGGQADYYAPYSFGQTQHTTTAPLYPDGYDTSGGAYRDGGYQDNGNGAYVPGSRKVVKVPEGYHVGSEHSPASFNDREKSWVNRQSPQNYTVELGDNEKASQVAATLQKAPKDARKAEIKYNRGGKKHYKGVYGTYSSYGAAQKALNALPEDLRKNARVKTWGSVQNSSGY